MNRMYGNAVLGSYFQKAMKIAKINCVTTLNEENNSKSEYKRVRLQWI